MTVNSPIPMAIYQDGPRTVGGTLDAAIDSRPYELVLTVVGPGRVDLLVKADMKYLTGSIIRFDGTKVSLLRNSDKTLIKDGAGGYGTYTVTLSGTSLTVKDASGKVVCTGTEATSAGLRTRYTVSGGAKVTTAGRLL